MSTRFYLDFDGEFSPTKPDAVNNFLLDSSVYVDKPEDTKQIIWVAHRPNEAYTVTKRLLPHSSQLIIADPTCSKVRAIIDHYLESPCATAVVFDVSLTVAEIRALNVAGIKAYRYRRNTEIAISNY